MTKRSSITPEQGNVPSGVHAMRRGGARREVSDRVSLLGPDGRVLEGWALNVSRGGLRAILEEKVDLGEQFDITLGAADDGLTRKGRVVWVQEEPDGVIVGLEFTSLSGMHKSVPPVAPEDAAPDVAVPPAAPVPDAAPTDPTPDGDG
ncbi:MAG: PilZ domain-containing protein [Myxococcales bacterium]|nr:PilZ domain-containing protein [Myxococcales bacterium]